jgi:hypothetical protein
MSGKHSAGKGDKYRPLDKKQYDKNYDEIFGKKNSKTKVTKNKNIDKIVNQLNDLFNGEI